MGAKKKKSAPVRVVERRKPVLIVQHAPHEHPAALRRALETQGIQTLWIHPYRGENYPKLKEISGMISLGGPMGANDEKEFPWIRPEIDLLKKSILSELPTIGICLGGQMIARALGAKVERHTQMEVGWFPIESTPAGKSDLVIGSAGKNPIVYHWHQDTFHLPRGAELLASSKGCARQLFRVGQNAYGFQFHPEADHQLVGEWLSIEGIDEEILEILCIGRQDYVQNGASQRAHALKGESASLRITAAISGLFRKRTAKEIASALESKIKNWIKSEHELEVEFEGSQRKPVQLRGKIKSLLELPPGSFIIFQEQSTLLWPIRVDDILKVRAISGLNKK